jgi:FdhD protein
MMGDGAVLTQLYDYHNGWTQVEAEVIEEALISLYVNGKELAAIMATPEDLESLAVGFLKNEGLIDTLDEIDHVHLSVKSCCVDVWLNRASERPERAILTPGCGNGITFRDLSVDLEPSSDDLSIRAEVLLDLLGRLHFPGSLYSRSRGVHSAGLSDGKELLAIAEDVGQHNSLDKLLGKCMQRGIETRGRILLATGRITSEMFLKGAMMGCPLIASRNSATSMTVAMARNWNITLIGYVRQNSMRVYAHPERIQSDLPLQAGE